MCAAKLIMYILDYILQRHKYLVQKFVNRKVQITQTYYEHYFRQFGIKSRSGSYKIWSLEWNVIKQPLFQSSSNYFTE